MYNSDHGQKEHGAGILPVEEYNSMVVVVGVGLKDILLVGSLREKNSVASLN